MTDLVRPPISPAAAAAVAALPLPAIGRSAHGGPEHQDHPATHAAPAIAPQPSGLSDVARMLSGHWEALADAMRIAPALQQLVPRPGAELGALALALLSALKQGTVDDWIGSGTHRALPVPLAAHLGDDFARMSRLNAADPGEWRFIPIPFMGRDSLGQALLFVRSGKRHDRDTDEDPGTRILLEFETPKFGTMQLDGLIRLHHFDLMVRSRAELPSETRGDIAALFDEARSIATLAGEIRFIATHDFFAPPLAAIRDDTTGVTA